MFIQFDASTHLRLIDKLDIDLRHCATVEEAWLELDSMFGNPVNVANYIVDEFLQFKPKGNSNATKLVDLKQAVFTLNMELTAVQHEDNLQANPHVLTHILSIMPHEYSKDFVRRQSTLKATRGSQWKALSEFLKEEANIINRDMPWLLDNRGDRSRFSSENIGNEKISPLVQSKDNYS